MYHVSSLSTVLKIWIANNFLTKGMQRKKSIYLKMCKQKSID